MKKRRILSMLLSLVLALGLMPVMSLTAFAGVPAVIGNTTTTWSGNATPQTDYVEINGDVTVNANMTLTIPQYHKVTVNGGIKIGDGLKLTVAGGGELLVLCTNTSGSSPTMGVGIWGDVTVDGATIDVVGASGRFGVRGNVTINNGSATITGGDGGINQTTGSGIPGGAGVYLGNVTVKGGEIIVKGGKGGGGKTAGRGGLGVSGNVTVDGGSVTVIGGDGGSGTMNPGDGHYGISGSLTINGGSVTVTGGNGGTTPSNGENSAAVASTITGTGVEESDNGISWSAFSAEKSTKQYVRLLGASGNSSGAGSSGVNMNTPTTLPYNGVAQPLVTGGSAAGGTLEYALGTDATNAPASGWSTSVPTATEPGTYYVWYRVVGDQNHNDVAPACIVVTIDKIPNPVANADYTLLTTIKTSGKKALKLSWTPVTGADGYDVFFGPASDGTAPFVTSIIGLNYTVKNLKKGVAYMAHVQAWKSVNGQKAYIGDASPDAYAITNGKNKSFTNAKKISVKKKKLTVAVGASKKIKVTLKKVSAGRKYLKGAAKVRYYSTDHNIATVDANGKVTGVAAGTCKVFAVTGNGLRAGVKITVK